VCLLTILIQLAVALVVSGLVVDDPQDLDEAEGGSQPAQTASWSGSTSAMARASYRLGGSSRRAPRCK
jgi:hypothetical protein